LGNQTAKGKPKCLEGTRVNYNPNINDPRVRARITQAIEWIEQFVSNKPNFLSTRHIDKHFGQGQLALSKWLRSKLLLEVDPHYNHLTGKCKKYRRNYDGWAEVKQLLNGFNSIRVLPPEQQVQLDTAQFEYTEKSNRYFNPLQNLPKQIKRTTFKQSGFNYNYDIICAAPRLLLQYARRCGMTKATPTLDAYINDAAVLRTQIANATGLTPKEVKFVVNAILQGAPITHRYNSSILAHLNNRHLLINNLQTNTDMIKLRTEISSLWKSIKLHRDIKERLSPKVKSSIYRELEQEVLKSIERYLKKNNNHYFKEHDGWMCKMIIDDTELRSYVRSMTGYSIEITCEIFE
jgi:hypothetical protein